MHAYDVIIIGAGLTGLTLAHALVQHNISVALIEKNPFPSLNKKNAAQPQDGRALALSLSAQNILQHLGLWQALESSALPIKAVHVSEQGAYGKVRLCATDMGWLALGYIVPYAGLGESLLQAVQSAAQIKIFSQTEVIGLEEMDAQTRSVSVRTAANETLTLTGRLIVLAEGNTANIKESVGFAPTESKREQQVIVADVVTTQAHNNIAYQRFTNKGILAILPRAQHKVTVVWTINNALEEWQALSDDAWLLRLQNSFGHKLGFFKAVGPRHYYPVRQFSIEHPYQARLLLLGNAAHTLSPVAAQGFNLTLRDIALLVELLSQAHQAQQDIGDLELLKNYQALRKSDQKTVYHFTDKLIEIFSWPYLKSVRSVGLLLCDRLPLFKKALIKRIEGVNERLA